MSSIACSSRTTGRQKAVQRNRSPRAGPCPLPEPPCCKQAFALHEKSDLRRFPALASDASCSRRSAQAAALALLQFDDAMPTLDQAVQQGSSTPDSLFCSVGQNSPDRCSSHVDSQPAHADPGGCLQEGRCAARWSSGEHPAVGPALLPTRDARKGEQQQPGVGSPKAGLHHTRPLRPDCAGVAAAAPGGCWRFQHGGRNSGG